MKEENNKKRLLLHCCCAPCATHCLEVLAKTFSITIYFYNPNIVPKTERDKRESELMRLILEMNKENEIQVLKVASEEELCLEPNNCKACINARLARTAQLANKFDFDYFTTTLTVSPHKDAVLINSLGKALSPKFLEANFKKQDGFKKSIELSRKYNLYRQNYCGCTPRAKTLK